MSKQSQSIYVPYLFVEEGFLISSVFKQFYFFFLVSDLRLKFTSCLLSESIGVLDNLLVDRPRTKSWGAYLKAIHTILWILSIILVM